MPSRSGSYADEESANLKSHAAFGSAELPCAVCWPKRNPDSGLYGVHRVLTEHPRPPGGAGAAVDGDSLEELLLLLKNHDEKAAITFFTDSFGESVNETE